jgi:hypothetical protein
MKVNGTADQRDPKALRILGSTYWSSSGWRPQIQTPPPEDMQYATAAGYMFPPASVTHDEIVRRVTHAARDSNPVRIADAFLGSLSSRRLDWRSALGSYVVAQFLPEHAFMPSSITNVCGICGAAAEEAIDYNILNFERHKWGGIRHHDPAYIALDLEQFARLPAPDPSDECRELLPKILGTVADLPEKAGPRPLEKALAKVFPSSKSERDVLLNILGLCGILAPAEHPGFDSRFVPYSDRHDPTNDDSDWQYPVEWWHASDGVNWAAVQRFFPDPGVQPP